jgi:serine/threonine protein kinase
MFDSLLPTYTVKPNLQAEGTFGRVYFGKNNQTEREVAIKSIQFPAKSFHHVKSLVREVFILNTLKEHPNIVFLEHFTFNEENNRGTLVFEHCDTDLHAVIRSGQPLSTEHLRYILFQILDGVHFIHSADIVHRDLKPANIFINQDCRIRIGDFGFARVIHGSNNSNAYPKPPQLSRQLTADLMSYWYRSPEMFLGDHRRGDKPSDLWSVGCIFAELILGKPLFPGKNADITFLLILKLLGTPKVEDFARFDATEQFHQMTTYPRLYRQNFQTIFDHFDPIALGLLEKMLDFMPAKRITAKEALRDPFLDLYCPERLMTFSSETMEMEDQDTLNDYLVYETTCSHPHSMSHTEQIKYGLSLLQKRSTHDTEKAKASGARVPGTLFHRKKVSFAQELEQILTIGDNSLHF